MEQRGIDLRKFIPEKANKWYLIKVLIYVTVLAVLFFYLMYQMERKKHQKLDETSIKGVMIEDVSNQN
jgi:hypothetical protein